MRIQFLNATSKFVHYTLQNKEKSIPAKEETIVDVELTSVQKKYYRAIYERNLRFLKKGSFKRNTVHRSELLAYIIILSSLSLLILT